MGVYPDKKQFRFLFNFLNAQGVYPDKYGTCSLPPKTFSLTIEGNNPKDGNYINKEVYSQAGHGGGEERYATVWHYYLRVFQDLP